MAAIPQSTRNSITLRLLDHAEAHWPQLTRVKVTYRGAFGYITGVLRNGENIPLCRLRYGGSAHSFGFAIYSAAHDRYQDAILRTGLPTGTPQEALDTAGVVVSELVTNAVTASAELRPAVAPVLVWLGSDSRRVLVAVADASPQLPMRLNLEPDADGGRGLALVEAFSSRWGWHPVTMAGLVKVVWAEWRLPSGIGERPTPGWLNRCHAV
jgi:anti-sigma regulatory factor (Ser/Thr protein kinase)